MHEFTTDDLAGPQWMPGTANAYFDVELPDGETGHAVVGVTATSDQVVAALNRMIGDVGVDVVVEQLQSADGLTLSPPTSAP
jgi:hypothetical protein